MKTIELNVEGLPEPFVHAVKKMVDALREQFQDNGGKRPAVELPAWPGKVIGSLTREEIYEDDGGKRGPVELLVRDGTVLTPLTREETCRDVG